MPRAAKHEPFSLTKPTQAGIFRGKRLLTHNYRYVGNAGELTLADLVNFLKEKKVALSDVPIQGSLSFLVDGLG